jgi:polyisoprenoid-binding protein YceI
MAWKIDAAHTSIEFSVKHMMIATVRGRFGAFDGTLDVDRDNLLNSTVEGYVETASVDTRDANRDGHLRSPDFFDAEKFSRMTFRSTKIEKAGDGQYKVTGDLTIKETTRPVTFDVTDEGRGKDPWGNLHWGVSASTTISRKDFGLNWNVALETGGWLVGDQVKINAEVELIATPDAVKQEEAEPVAA